MEDKAERVGRSPEDKAELAMDQMVEKEQVSETVWKYKIPDDIWRGSRSVQVEGEELTIFDVLDYKKETAPNSAHDEIISRSVEDFIRSIGTPAWSHVRYETFIGGYTKKLERYPKELLISKNESGQ